MAKHEKLLILYFYPRWVGLSQNRISRYCSFKLFLIYRNCMIYVHVDLKLFYKIQFLRVLAPNLVGYYTECAIWESSAVQYARWKDVALILNLVDFISLPILFLKGTKAWDNSEFFWSESKPSMTLVNIRKKIDYFLSIFARIEHLIWKFWIKL